MPPEEVFGIRIYGNLRVAQIPLLKCSFSLNNADTLTHLLGLLINLWGLMKQVR